jgi:hypothetical protein
MLARAAVPRHRDVDPRRAQPLKQVEHLMVFGQDQRGESPDSFLAGTSSA